MNELLVGYARVSTEQQDLTDQRNGLHALGVGDDRVYVDHGLTGTNRDRPGLRLALAAYRGVTRWLSPSWTGSPVAARRPGHPDELTKRNVRLGLAGRSMIQPTRWGGCCSTSWRWWRSLRLI